MMKLYTKHGDDGSTSLFGGKRVSKTDPRVVAYGSVDELNAVLGVAVSESTDDETNASLRTIQSELFVLGAELATPSGTTSQSELGDDRIAALERLIDSADGACAPLTQFILPGGCPAAAQLHLARTVCRRAERAVIALAAIEPVRDAIVIYLNRLSDLLFAMARLANQRAGYPDIPWVNPGR